MRSRPALVVLVVLFAAAGAGTGATVGALSDRESVLFDLSGSGGDAWTEVDGGERDGRLRGGFVVAGVAEADADIAKTGVRVAEADAGAGVSDAGVAEADATESVVSSAMGRPLESEPVGTEPDANGSVANDTRGEIAGLPEAAANDTRDGTSTNTSEGTTSNATAGEAAGPTGSPAGVAGSSDGPANGTVTAGDTATDPDDHPDPGDDGSDQTNETASNGDAGPVGAPGPESRPADESDSATPANDGAHNVTSN